MRRITVISIFLILSLCFGITVSAESGCAWYIEKRGNQRPGFPSDADFISKHHGYYIDSKSNETGNKVLYLTFDAGYENGNIEKIMDIMKDEDITGAFFILSNLINKNPELVRRMVSDGHLVCNHTSNHKDLSSLGRDDIIANLKSLEA